MKQKIKCLIGMHDFIHNDFWGKTWIGDAVCFSVYCKHKACDKKILVANISLEAKAALANINK